MSDAPKNTVGPLLPRWQVIVPFALVLLVAFLLASVPAYNSDVWRHLATGRALMWGSYTFGVDPFAYTTEGVRWINHAWLYDLVLYALYHSGVERLVFFNAVLAIALAVFMLLQAGWPKTPALAAICVAIAFVAVGPHLVLGPAVVSYLLFSVTVWWLGRARSDFPADWSLRRHIPLLLVLVLWANCDEWFLLGPITVAVFAFVAILRKAPDVERRCLIILIIASATVCLVNPHHVWVFRLPTALEAPTSPLSGLALRSWDSIPVPLVACALLILLVIASFLEDRSVLASPPTPICIGLLGLSLYCDAAIPFFAIAAGPLAARRLSVRFAASAPPRFPWLAPACAATSLAVLAALACPGWLQGPFAPRGWHVYVDPSMQRMAQRLAERRDRGELGVDARSLAVSVDLAHYLEWHCPAEKVFLDGRVGVFPVEVITDHQQVRTALAGPPTDYEKASVILARWGVTHLVVTDAVDRRLAAELRTLWQHPREWTASDIEGRAALFVRNRLVGAPGLTAIDLNARAFDAALATKAPRHGPGREPIARSWWDCFTWTEPYGTIDRDEAVVELAHFDAMRPAYFERNRYAWETGLIATQFGMTLPPFSSGLQAVSSGVPFMLVATSRRTIPPDGAKEMDFFAAGMLGAYAKRTDEGPPGSLFLAVRAARRAINANPDDAHAYLRLGMAYERLHHHTAEHGVGADFPLVIQLRKTQALIALHRAVKLRPDLQPAHELLVVLYEEAGGYDLALPHRQALLRLSRTAGVRPGETTDAFAERIAQLTDREARLGKQVRELLNIVDTQSFKLNVLAKAELAERMGLPGYALEQLLKSNDGEFGTQGAVLQLHLMLRAGRTTHFRAILDPAHENSMGTFNYGWLKTLLAAADGDYDDADALLPRLLPSTVDVPDLGLQAVAPRNAVGLIFGGQMLRGASYDPWQTPDTGPAFLGRLDYFASKPRQQADLHTLRGLLALESGAIEPARAAFREALVAWDGNAGSAALARHYLNLMARK